MEIILTIIGLIVGGILIFGAMLGSVQDGIDSWNFNKRRPRWLCKECDIWYVGLDGSLLFNYDDDDDDDDNPDPDKTTVNTKKEKYPTKRCSTCKGMAFYKGKR